MNKMDTNRKRLRTAIRDDVVSKKIFRSVKEYFDMKLDRLENYKTELTNVVDHDQTILSYADHFVQLNFNTQILSMFNIDLKEFAEVLLALISPKQLKNELQRK